MPIQFSKILVVKDKSYTLNEIYDKNFAFFLTNDIVETMYCKETNLCYHRDQVVGNWSKIDQSAEIKQLQIIKDQLGEISQLNEVKDDLHVVKFFGRGNNAALRGSVVIEQIQDLEQTCYSDYYNLSATLSFASPKLTKSEAIVNSNVKVNIYGTKFNTRTKVVAIDNSVPFPNIQFELC